MNQFQVYVTPQALAEIKDTPGNVRQRIRHIIQELAKQPHPTHSQQLKLVTTERQLFRIRLDNWRIIYAISETEKVIDILAIRKRPPYDYGDLQKILEILE